MSNLYFSERELGQKPRIENEIGDTVWGGIATFINSSIDNGYLGNKFPQMCPDNDGIVGSNVATLSLAVVAEFQEVQHIPLDAANKPPTLIILDLLEFFHEHIAKPAPIFFHQFWGVDHLKFDVEAGQIEFRQRINRLFARNGIAFELQENGQIARLAPVVISDMLQNAVFRTGDPFLDAMLEAARVKYLDPSLQIRLEALEKLWDAWERIKTLENPADKKKSIGLLLDRAAAEPSMRGRLESEAAELTEIGNKFMIRHTEAGRTPITSSAHIDYLFHRMFALIYLLLENRSVQGVAK